MHPTRGTGNEGLASHWSFTECCVGAGAAPLFPAMAKKELEYTSKLSPNFSQADEIKKVLAGSPSNN